MKHRIENFVSLIIAVSMLLSLIPFYAAALDDEFEGMETLDEVPFTFELEQGDLPFEELAEATLSAEDVPACIDPLLAEARGHVNRLYLQEPDDYTVMFQNRDGSKTVYVFSQPVKGSIVSTTAAIQVNNGTIIFSGSNAITSLIGELHDYNIGYCEIQTLNSGILTADGVNITADAREWARGESFASNLVYNMSSEAAAEYNMSISENATVTAAATPGITITPIDPTPESGITVMAISYSTLAGLMSFKNVSTNQFLTLTTSSSPSLTINSSIIDPYSRWYVQYDSYYGYMVSNYSNVYNTYLGFDDTDEFIIDSTSPMLYAMTVNIVSTANSIVTISCDQLAISSTGALYEKSVDDDSFPESCQWEISSKYNITLVSRIDLNSNTRVEQSGVDFYLDYGVTPSTANSYDISLYNATTHQEITHDTEAEEDEYAYYIDTSGVYSVYYKDSITGVKSANFTLIVTETIGAGQPVSFVSNHTYAIQPYGYGDKFLTMQDKDNNGTTANSFRVESLITKWYNQSQTFVFNTASGDNYSRTIFATLSTVQSGAPANYRIGTVTEYTQAYYYPDIDSINNALNYTAANGLTGKTKSATNSTAQVYDIGGYYVISFGANANNELLALKYVANATTDEPNAIVTEYNPSDTAFRWNISYVGVDTRLIKQTLSSGCGATATLMFMYGMGLNEAISALGAGSDLTAQQTVLRSNSHLQYNTTEYITVGRIKNYINNRLLTTEPYDYYTTDNDQRQKLSTGIDNGYIMICHVSTELFPYYKGTKFTHYINVIGKIVVNTTTHYVVADCIFDDQYFGIHIVEAEDLISATGWLIAKE